MVATLSQNISINSPLNITIAPYAITSPSKKDYQKFIDIYSPIGNQGAASLFKEVVENSGECRVFEKARAFTLDELFFILYMNIIQILSY